jgi:hypothetical protein
VVILPLIKELNAPTNSVDCANLLNMKSEKGCHFGIASLRSGISYRL